MRAMEVGEGSGRPGLEVPHRLLPLLLETGGVLATCSCSHHIDEALFREILINAAFSAGRQARLLEMRSQARDHPVLLAARETQYLKCAILQVD